MRSYRNITTPVKISAHYTHCWWATTKKKIRNKDQHPGCGLYYFPKAVDPDSGCVRISLSQLLAVSRVSVSNPTLRAVDLLEASRMSSADSKGNILHGESIRLKSKRMLKWNTLTAESLITHHRVTWPSALCSLRAVHPGVVFDYRHEASGRYLRRRAF